MKVVLGRGAGLRPFVRKASVPDLAFIPLLLALSGSLPNPLRIAAVGSDKGRTMLILQRYFHVRGIRILIDGYDVLQSEVKIATEALQREAVEVEDLRVLWHGDLKTIPLADESYDVVLPNQVFEHVNFFDEIVSECARILKPACYLVTCFPTKEIAWEGHLYLPFVHWFKHSRAAYYFILLCLLGLKNEYWRANPSPRAYAPAGHKWLIESTNYQTCASAKKLSRFFSVEDFSYPLFAAKFDSKGWSTLRPQRQHFP